MEEGRGFMRTSGFFDDAVAYEKSIEIAQFLNAYIYGDENEIYYLPGYGVIYDDVESENPELRLDDLLKYKSEYGNIYIKIIEAVSARDMLLTIIKHIGNGRILKMKREKLIQFLQSTDLISLQKAEEIVTHFTKKVIHKNEFFLKEGKVCNEYLFLERGFMRAFAYDTDGNDITTSFYSDCHVVFEVSSFFNRTTSKENIQALTDCEGWCITYEQLNHLFHSLHEFREFGRSVLVKGFATLKIRMLSMITETAEERYAQLLKSNPEMFQYAPLKHIASYLGVTDTSLSRIRKEYSKK